MRDFYVDIAKIESWQPKGSYTFEVTLKQVNPAFLYMLPFPCFLVVPEEMSRYTLEEFSSYAVGSGPFEVGTRNPTVLHYNEDYWKGEPYLTEIEYVIVNPEDLISEFEKKTIDYCLIPHEYWDAFTPYTVVTVPRFEILYIGLNCQKPPFTDVRVRKAINYALDPGAGLDQIYKGKAVKATSILPPGFVCHTSRDLYARDVEKAIQLLEEAGYTGTPRLQLELTSSESYIQQQFNQMYTDQLKEIGIDLTVEYLDLGSLLHAVDTGDTQLFTLGWYTDWPYPDQFLFLFHSSNWGAGGNGSFYNSETVDDLLEKAARETDMDKACSLFKKAEDTILEDAVWVLQWRRVDGYAVQEWINGFNPGGMGIKYEKLDTVWISADYRQTTRIPQNGKDVPLLYGGVIIGMLLVLIRMKRKIK
jgi:ABC-type transport system substrate-binding protein